jgi:two-component system NtrC family response regulator
MSDPKTSSSKKDGGRVLVVDDEPIVCKSCEKVLAPEGYSVSTTQTGRDGIQKGHSGAFDVVIVDLKMPDVDGMEVLASIKEKQPDVEVIVITGYSTVSTAVEAMKLGAIDYLPKPFTPDELCVVVSKAFEKRKLVAENRQLREELEEKFGLENIVGKSKVMQDVYKLVRKVAPTNSTVLIYGQSGTGKELLAKAIHYNSLRKKKQFLPADCSALAPSLLESELFGHVKGSFTGATVTKPGLFELADGGTLFLDEIGNMSLETQGKLLRVLEDGEFKPVGGTEFKSADVRLIAATNKNLDEMTRQEAFREDLFYRINVFPITLPALRERRSDIPILAWHFLKRQREETGKDIRGFTPEAMNILMNAPWPGNVRELKNTIERLVISGEGKMIRAEDLPPNLRKAKTTWDNSPIPRTGEELRELKKHLRQAATERIERSFLLDALERHNWNVSKAAQETGIQRPNFHAMMRRHGIRRESQ